MKITRWKAKEALERGFADASKLLKTPYKVDQLLHKTKETLKLIPKAGKELSYVPAMISLVRSYMKKEYTQVPVRTILAILSALMYVVNPFDIIPDSIPGIGYADDTTVVLICWDLVKSGVKEYEAWRKRH